MRWGDPAMMQLRRQQQSSALPLPPPPPRLGAPTHLLPPAAARPPPLPQSRSPHPAALRHFLFPPPLVAATAAAPPARRPPTAWAPASGAADTPGSSSQTGRCQSRQTKKGEAGRHVAIQNGCASLASPAAQQRHGSPHRHPPRPQTHPPEPAVAEQLRVYPQRVAAGAALEHERPRGMGPTRWERRRCDGVNSGNSGAPASMHAALGAGRKAQGVGSGMRDGWAGRRAPPDHPHAAQQPTHTRPPSARPHLPRLQASQAVPASSSTTSPSAHPVSRPGSSSMAVSRPLELLLQASLATMPLRGRAGRGGRGRAGRQEERQGWRGSRAAPRQQRGNTELMCTALGTRHAYTELPCTALPAEQEARQAASQASAGQAASQQAQAAPPAHRRRPKSPSTCCTARW